MHGIIVRYDPLTQCGLLRTNAGQVHYFRRDEVVSSGPVATGCPVALRNGVLVDTGGSRMDAHVPNPPSRPVTPPPVPAAPTSSGPYFGWIGGGLAAFALFCLLLAGGQQDGYVSASPKLIESAFGMAAVALLVVLTILFFMRGTRRQVRLTYWLTVWSSLFAYVGQTFDGFEIDQAAAGYGYTLLALFVAVYVIPHKRR